MSRQKQKSSIEITAEEAFALHSLVKNANLSQILKDRFEALHSFSGEAQLTLTNKNLARLNSKRVDEDGVLSDDE